MVKATNTKFIDEWNQPETINLISVIYDQMATDEGGDQKQSDRLERLYNEGTDRDRFIIDEVLMCLCGWSFEAIKSQNWQAEGK